MNGNTPDLEVSVVIPCLDEARTVGVCVRKALAAFERTRCVGEVVVCDNGSTDDSVAVATEAGARVIHEAARGYGQALRRAFSEARGQFIIMGDADDSYDFSEIDEFIRRWREGHQFVMGSRLRGRILPGAMPWLHRWIGVPTLTMILNHLAGLRISDAHCGLRGISRSAYQKLDVRTTGMEFASEMIIKAGRRGVKLSEVPITYHPDRRGRPSHLRTFRDGWRHLRFMLLYSATHLFILPGTTLVALGGMAIGLLAKGPVTLLGVTADLGAMVAGMVSVLLGLSIVLIGLFAKVFSYTERLSDREQTLEKYLTTVTLETGLLVGVLSILVGVAVFALEIPGRFLPPGRGMILGATLAAAGIQIVFASFFLSMLGISRDTYVGDYDVRRRDASR